jgi:DNA-binding LytR/AlgR family response regulator
MAQARSGKLRRMDAAVAFLRTYWQSFAAAAFAGVFLAAVGAFGTGERPLLTRLVYWVPLILAGTAAGFAVALRMMRRPKIGENQVLLWAIVTAAVSVPGTLLVWGYTALVFGSPPSSIAMLFLDVVIVSGAAAAIMMLINRPGPATRAAPPTASGAPAPVRFLDRLPPKLKGATLYAVEAEDHYLRLRTSKGSDLILLRMADAIAELDGIEGAQVHRSWWVAKDAIAEVKRADRRVTLVLKDGAVAPVSRPNIAALRESGWF